MFLWERHLFLSIFPLSILSKLSLDFCLPITQMKMTMEARRTRGRVMPRTTGSMKPASSVFTLLSSLPTLLVTLHEYSVAFSSSSRTRKLVCIRFSSKICPPTNWRSPIVSYLLASHPALAQVDCLSQQGHIAPVVDLNKKNAFNQPLFCFTIFYVQRIT